MNLWHRFLAHPVFAVVARYSSGGVAIRYVRTSGFVEAYRPSAILDF